jgi:hypothetical protein
VKAAPATARRVLQGDATYANALRDRHNRPLLGDLDAMAIGPAALEFGSVVNRASRLDEPDRLTAVSRGYGRQVDLDDPLVKLATLADGLRLALSVASRAHNPKYSRVFGPEAELRIRSLVEDTPETWTSANKLKILCERQAPGFGPGY